MTGLFIAMTVVQFGGCRERVFGGCLCVRRMGWGGDGLFGGVKGGRSWCQWDILISLFLGDVVRLEDVDKRIFVVAVDTFTFAWTGPG